MLHSFSMGELLIIFAIIIVLFGGSRLASVGKSLGEGIANFKKGLNNVNNAEETPETAATQKAPYVTAQSVPSQAVPGQTFDSYKERKADIVDVEANDKSARS